MDETTWMSWAGFILGVSGTLYAGINHRRIRSSCCGKKIEASLDVDTTTPTKA